MADGFVNHPTTQAPPLVEDGEAGRAYQHVWPTFFPGGCPPDGAEVATGVVLRLVSNNPPAQEDFRPWAVENGRVLQSAAACKSCAMSVYDQLEDVRRLQRRVPGQRLKSVAQGVLTPEMGVTRLTPGKESSHRSWWAPDALDPSAAFEVVAPPFSEEDA